MKPKEGTILTVAKGVSDKAAEVAEETEDIEEALLKIIEHAELVLSKTPEMLPVLKEAGVVDSGGQGLMEVLKGAVDCILGRVVIADTKPSGAGVSGVDNPKYSEDLSADIKFGYCTEFIILLNKPCLLYTSPSPRDRG